MEIPHKLVLLGSSGVGKSNLVLRFVKDQFTESLESTIGAVFLTQSMKRADGKTIKFEIWDTAGQENILPTAIVVYDITIADTLDRAREYIQELRQVSPNALVVLAGNKTDLSGARKVLKKEAQALALSQEVQFFETSAKTGENIREIFQYIAEHDNREAIPPPPNRLDEPDTNPGCTC